MERYDYEPMIFELHPHRWLEIAMRMPDNIRYEIIKRMAYSIDKISFFQSEMERIMYLLSEQGMLYQKSQLQQQIDSHIYKGEWK